MNSLGSHGADLVLPGVKYADIVTVALKAMERTDDISQVQATAIVRVLEHIFSTKSMENLRRLAMSYNIHVQIQARTTQDNNRFLKQLESLGLQDTRPLLSMCEASHINRDKNNRRNITGLWNDILLSEAFARHVAHLDADKKFEKTFKDYVAKLRVEIFFEPDNTPRGPKHDLAVMLVYMIYLLPRANKRVDMQEFNELYKQVDYDVRQGTSLGKYVHSYGIGVLALIAATNARLSLLHGLSAPQVAYVNNQIIGKFPDLGTIFQHLGRFVATIVSPNKATPQALEGIRTFAASLANSIGQRGQRPGRLLVDMLSPASPAALPFGADHRLNIKDSATLEKEPRDWLDVRDHKDYKKEDVVVVTKDVEMKDGDDDSDEDGDPMDAGYDVPED